MNKIFKISLVIIGIVLSSASVGKSLYMKVYDKGLIKKYSFENSSEISNWSVRKGKLALSDVHFKNGLKSLMWSWKKGDRLSVSNMEGVEKAAGFYQGGIPEKYEPSFYPKGKFGGLKMWLYQEKANSGDMVFQIGSSDKAALKSPKYRFAVNLNFTGWRAVWVQFNDDASVPNYKGDDKMSSLVALPSNNKNRSGKIFIDHLQFLEFISNKRHSDFVFQNKKSAARVDSYEILEPYKKLISHDFGKQNLSNEELNSATKEISNRLEYLIVGEGKFAKKSKHASKTLKNKIKLAKKYYKTADVKRQNGNITGIPMFATRDEHGETTSCTYQVLGQNTMFPLAMDYRVNNSEESKEQLMNLFHHFIDQGWVAGSSLGTVDHIIRLSGFGTSLFLLRDELKKEGILSTEQKMLAWHTRIGNMIDIDQSKGENSDMIRGGAIVKLISILLMENGAAKEGMLKHFTQYMDYVTAFSPGFMDTMKPDFSLFHHRGTYLNSYGVQAVNTMALIHWLLQDTPYEMSAQSTANIKNALIRQYEIAFGLDLHYGVCGRFPYQNKAIDRFLLPAYAFMSMKGHEIKDKKLASVYKYLYKLSKPKAISAILFPALTYSGTFGTIELMAELNKKQKVQTPPSDLNLTMPYSALQVHRKGKAYAAVKGYSKYVWDYETGHKGENKLGRYLSHGAMFVAQTDSKKGLEGSGFVLNGGFHWGYLPAATTKAMPIEKIYFVDKPTIKYVEGYHRSYTKTTFVGGVSQNNKNGVYSMELRDDVGPDKDMSLFDSTFRARKSYFFFGDDIVCLGSNIQNIDKRYNTITTLFQNQVSESKPVTVNEKSIGGNLDYKKVLNGGLLTDQQGLFYTIPKGNNVVVEQGLQKSLKRNKNKTYSSTSVAYTKAWIDHGTSPKDQKYDYAVLLNRAKDFKLKNRTIYSVIQQDAKAHVVYHKASNSTGYAIFDKDQKFKNQDVYGVDTPSILMWSRSNSNATLSIANPDLNMVPWNHNMSHMPLDITNATISGCVVSIVLNGNWAPAKVVYELMSISNSNGKTTIKVYCKDSKSIDLPLRYID